MADLLGRVFEAVGAVLMNKILPADMVRAWFDVNRCCVGKMIATSLPGDPVHVGHIRLLRASAEIADREDGRLVVIVNGDGFLLRKKGYVFLPLAERMEIIAAIEGVDFVVPWDDDTQFVDQALRLLQPDFFTKGGDRSSPTQITTCELKACEDIGCEIIYGVGGRDKPQSSSWLIEKLRKQSTHAPDAVPGSKT